jgi:hypothetical protein
MIDNPDDPFPVIQVKLLKCLVDNLVVDVSFNQLGGLCALNFLEEINRSLRPDHMLKKSIILVRLKGSLYIKRLQRFRKSYRARVSRTLRT